MVDPESPMEDDGVDAAATETEDDVDKIEGTESFDSNYDSSFLSSNISSLQVLRTQSSQRLSSESPKNMSPPVSSSLPLLTLSSLSENSRLKFKMMLQKRDESLLPHIPLFLPPKPASGSLLCLLDQEHESLEVSPLTPENAEPDDEGVDNVSIKTNEEKLLPDLLADLPPPTKHINP